MNIYKPTQGGDWFGTNDAASTESVKQNTKSIQKLQESMHHLKQAKAEKTKKGMMPHVVKASQTLEELKKLETVRLENERELRQQKEEALKELEDESIVLGREKEKVIVLYNKDMTRNKTATKLPDDDESEGPQETDEGGEETIKENEGNCYLVRL